MSAEIKSIGILAGEGALPHQLVAYCNVYNLKVCVVQFSDCTYQEFNTPHILKTRIEKVGEIFTFLKSNNVIDVVMIGNLSKPPLTSLRPDIRGFKTLGRIASSFLKGDDNLLRSLRIEIENEGFKVRGIDYFLDNLTVQSGCLTTAKISLDFKNGVTEALRYGTQDKGQSILLHSDGTYSYETRDGTTALILNEGRAGSILIKMMKPQQDPDLDRPTIGLQTLEALNKKQCLGMVIQANSVFIIDKDAMIKYANTHGLAIEVVNV